MDRKQLMQISGIGLIGAMTELDRKWNENFAFDAEIAGYKLRPDPLDLEYTVKASHTIKPYRASGRKMTISAAQAKRLRKNKLAKKARKR